MAASVFEAGVYLRTITDDVVAIDQRVLFNGIGDDGSFMGRNASIFLRAKVVVAILCVLTP